jgi:hypothetical protein
MKTMGAQMQHALTLESETRANPTDPENPRKRSDIKNIQQQVQERALQLADGDPDKARELLREVVLSYVPGAAEAIVQQRDKARVAATEAQLRATANRIDLFRLDQRELPKSLNDIYPAGEESNGLDVWGTALIYQQTVTGQYLLASAGPDRAPGTADDLRLAGRGQSAEPSSDAALSGSTLSKVEVTITAIADPGTAFDGPLDWTLINSQTEDLQAVTAASSELTIELMPGVYEVFAKAESAAGQGSFEVGAGADQRFQISMATRPESKAFNAPPTASAGSVIRFNWNGPNAAGDMVFVTEPNLADNRYPLSNHHLTASGPTAVLTVPAQPGQYEIRYFSKANGAVLTRTPLEVTYAQVTLDSPDTIPAGTPFEFEWLGPNAPGDLLFTTNGTKGVLIAPGVTGTYHLRYYSKPNGRALVKKDIRVTAAEVVLDAPRTSSPGASITVNWSGPGARGDMLFIVKPGLAANKYWTRNHPVSRGTPAILTVPAEPGTYEIRYYSMNNSITLGKRNLIVQ